ncbi:phospholipase D-like domain-containing protein [Pragia fontium]|uniref:phospholipase D-like domain-containing protein n=1 Tax=Pragia fontium TaxID=82985 RepID=UPI00064B5F50|nr:phospholipase D-like domain-containing protein [Pragia fontium]AKJ41907.1 hypothetical protein QQ39_07275 [Pragia fontium]VEJ54803.1 cardiolipin synthetase [Pragia fontium]
MAQPDEQKSQLKIIVDNAGKAMRSDKTRLLWGTADNQFAPKRSGNQATPLISGREYFNELCRCIEAAESEIAIVGWQVNWDVQLKPEEAEKSTVRLYDIIKKQLEAKENLKVWIMIWAGDPRALYTYSEDTKKVFDSLNDQLKRKDAVRVQLSVSMPDDTKSFYSHHQKYVVIDRKIALLGGMDLAYGRYDDACYSLHPDIRPDLKEQAVGRQMLNRYNPCISQVGEFDTKLLVDPDLLTGPLDSRGNGQLDVLKKINETGWQGGKAESVNPYRGINNVTLDERRQPRMPWQDVHVKLQGNVVFDLLRNFSLRWNCQASVADCYPLPTLEEIKQSPLYEGKCDVQVLRSAPKSMCESEYKALSKIDREEAVNYAKTNKHQDEVYQAMRKLIATANEFIYIENQFFTSFYGQEQDIPQNQSIPAQAIKSWLSSTVTRRVQDKLFFGNSNVHDGGTIHNTLCADLAARIHQHIISGTPFHVYIVLPVHPEGSLYAATVMNQVFWTMQSLVSGEQSLLKRVRLSLEMKRIIDELRGDIKNAEIQKQALQQAESNLDGVKISEADYQRCQQYITLLNLRNWANIGDYYVTEQIYVHNKTMVVDDKYAIIGSVNINDRSLLGTRDSEISVMLIDNEHDGQQRAFAKNLRISLWKKILGIADNSDNSRPQVDASAFIDSPGSEAARKTIQDIARQNTELYDRVFSYIPKNYSKDKFDNLVPSSYIPLWPRDGDSSLFKKVVMPNHSEFWSAGHLKGTFSTPELLSQIKGYITLLPIFWGFDERNDLGFPKELLTQSTPILGHQDEDDIQIVNVTADKTPEDIS